MLVTPLDSIIYLIEIRNVCLWLSFLHDSFIFGRRCSSISMFFDKWQNFVHYKLVSNWLFLLLFFNSMLVLCV